MSVTIHPAARAAVRGAMQRVLAEIAFRVEAHAKNAAPVDTGFLRASIHAIVPSTPGVAATVEQHAGRSYTSADTRAARGDEALVVCAAAYAYWVERRTPFLLPAALAVATDVGAIVKEQRV